MTIQIRHYQPGDEEGIVQTWRESLPQDPITEELFRKKVLLDANFHDKAAIVAVDDQNTVIGFALSLIRHLPMIQNDLEPDNGWITVFFIHPNYRRRGIAAQMFEQIFNYQQEHHRKNLFFSSYAPNYFLPGIDEQRYGEGLAFLRKLGFNVLYSPVAMHRSLVGFEIPEKVRALKREREAAGYRFIKANDRYLYPLIQFATHKFNPDWGRAIREGMLQGMTFEQIWVAENNGRIVGFCLHGAYEGIQERFGPFGVDPELQGTGLGKILLYECLFDMRAKGLHGAWFLWTGEQSAAGHLYKKAGFSVTRKFHVMKKILEV